ncbi:MAG: ATP-dependent zinc protease family protein [Paracoccaceae bacterium]
MTNHPTLVIGWQERVSLPQLGLTNLNAKIDTGARTSALHATDIREFTRDGAPWVRFHSRFDDDTRDLDVECPIYDRRDITNTSGVPEPRIVIRTRFRLAGRAWQADVSLTERSEMAFRMIVGRTAIRGHRILVDPGKRHLTTDLADRGPTERTIR